MNTSTKIENVRTTLVAAAVASVLAACASAPVRPAGAAEARARLTQLESDPTLANRAPVAVEAAETAVRLAEQPETDQTLIAYRVYMADRKVDTARVQAETRLAEDQRSALRAQSEKARLDARTREVDVARSQAAAARAEGAEQRLAADSARDQADAANLAAANSDQQALDARSDADNANLAVATSKRQAEELQQQIDALQATATDRGLVITLDDVLFSGDGSVLTDDSSGNLNRLVAFLDQYPERTATIEGYSDGIGNDDYSQARSQRRADSVKSYLIGRGISSDRLTASRQVDSFSVAGDDSPSGRKHNRRVEVTIDNPAALR